MASEAAYCFFRSKIQAVELSDIRVAIRYLCSFKNTHNPSAAVNGGRVENVVAVSDPYPHRSAALSDFAAYTSPVKTPLPETASIAPVITSIEVNYAIHQARQRLWLARAATVNMTARLSTPIKWPVNRIHVNIEAPLGLENNDYARCFLSITK